MTMSGGGGLDSVLTLDQRKVGVMMPRPLTTLHVGGCITGDCLTVNGPLTVNGSVTVTGNIQTATLGVTGGSTFFGRATFTGGDGQGIATATPNLGALEVQSSPGTGAAKISFHRPGYFAAYFGIDTDNVWAVGGWSHGAARYRLILGDGYQNPDVRCRWLYVTDGANGVVQAANGNLYVRSAGTNYYFDSGGSIICSGPVISNHGQGFQCVDTNNGFYWDRSTLAQWASTGAIWRHYQTATGRYFDMSVGADSYTTLGGWAPNFACSNMRFAGAGGYLYWIDSNASITRLTSENAFRFMVYDGKFYFTRTWDGFQCGYIDTAGWHNGSRLAFKTAITPITDGLKLVLDERIRPVRYMIPAGPAVPEAPRAREVYSMGFGAEDVAPVIPEVVGRDDKGEPETINYGALVAVLWDAVRTLNARIETLEQAAA